MTKNDSLKTHFPLLFSKNLKNPINFFGFECGDGWYSLLYSTFYTLYSKYSSASYYEKIQLKNLKNFGNYYETYYNLHAYNQSDKDLYFHLLEIIEKAKKETLRAKKNLPKIEQVKEKYGTLRIYYSGGDKFVAGAIAVAESLSETTCEVCGQKSSINSLYKKSLCDEHANRRYS